MATMKTSSLIVDKIIRENSISEYLDSKGLFPVVYANGRKKYICPLHKEKDASFVVFTNDEGIESFFCFGCKAGGNYINLYSLMERKSIKSSVEDLGKGFQISDQAQLDFILDRIKDDISKSKVFAKNDIAELAMKLSVLSFNVLELTNYDQAAVDFMEQAYQIVDKCVAKEDYNSLEKIYDSVVKEKLLTNKIKQILACKKDKMKEKLQRDIALEEGTA